MTQPLKTLIADVAPDAATVTPYDRDHIKLYVRLLDAEKAGRPARRSRPCCLALIRR